MQTNELAAIIFGPVFWYSCVGLMSFLFYDPVWRWIRGNRKLSIKKVVRSFLICPLGLVVYLVYKVLVWFVDFLSDKD